MKTVDNDANVTAAEWDISPPLSNWFETDIIEKRQSAHWHDILNLLFKLNSLSVSAKLTRDNLNV